MEKGEIAIKHHILLFQQCFLSIQKEIRKYPKIHVQILQYSSVDYLSMEESKIFFLCSKELTLYHTILTFNDIEKEDF